MNTAIYCFKISIQEHVVELDRIENYMYLSDKLIIVNKI